MQNVFPQVSPAKTLIQFILNGLLHFIEKYDDFWYGGIISNGKIYSSSSGYELLNHESFSGEIRQIPTINFASLPQSPCIKMSKTDGVSNSAGETIFSYKVIDCNAEKASFLCIKQPMDCSLFNREKGIYYKDTEGTTPDMI